MATRKKKSSNSSLFVDQLKEALKYYHKPEWLTEHSPLATPYFLGAALSNVDKRAEMASGWGELLRQEIQKAASTLWGDSLPVSKEQVEQAVEAERMEQSNKGPRYHYLLLELRYFRHYFTARDYPQQVGDIPYYLNVSRARFFKHLEMAIPKLGQILLAQVRPTFRLEHPRLQTALIGREEVLQTCLSALQARQSVAISGMGGIGKTTLATAIAHNWSTEAIFWYTIRPTLNDQLSSLLFSLAHFLHEQGTSNLWQLLVAQKGKVEQFNLVLALVREDLAALQQQDLSALLCFDELDRLRPISAEQPIKAHTQILEFLEGLRGVTSLLFIGQGIPLDTDLHYALSGLTPAQITILLKQAAIPFTPEELQRLHKYTGGNPRLLQLCIALHQESETVSDLLRNMPQAPALQPLFERVWQRLNTDERHMLQALSVFRTFAPTDAWQAEHQALDGLIKRHLVQQDEQGGVALLPAIRELVYGDLSAELREQQHLAAAPIRAMRGEYTSAAYHYWQGGEDGLAIQAWYPYREQEIQRGQADAALTIFQEISLRRQHDKKERQALALLRAELYKLTGEAEKGKADLQAVNWSPDSDATIQAYELWGRFVEALGYPHKALEKYEEGMDVTARLLNQLVSFRYQRGIVHLRQRAMKDAWKEARLAQYHAENLQGRLLEEQGRYIDAELQYRRTLTIAESLNYHVGIAKAHEDLFGLLGRQPDKFNNSMIHAKKAINYYERIGDRFSIAKIRNNLSSAYLQTRQFHEAIEAGTLALAFFESIHYAHGIGATAANLAESYFETGDLQNAQKYARYVLDQEEPHAYPYGLFTLGLVARAEKRVGDAEQVFSQCAQIAEQNEDKYMVAYAKRALGEVYFEQKKAEEGKRAVKEALSLFEQMGMTQEVSATETLLAGVG